MDIQVFKKERIPHYNWSTRLIYNDGQGFICHNTAPRTLNHQTRGKVFTFQTDVIEYYWKETPFSLHISLDRQTNKLHYYTNIHSYPVINDEYISFIDYDLDVIREDVSPAYIVDQEEFEKHRVLYNYSREIQRSVPIVADKVVTLLNENDLFQKEIILRSFEKIDLGERKFLSQWTGLFPNE